MRLVYYDIVIVFMQSIDHRSLPLAAKTASIEDKMPFWDTSCLDL